MADAAPTPNIGANIKFDDWTVRDNQTGNTFSIHLYDGRYMFFVRSGDRSQRGFLFNKRVNRYQMTFLRRLIEKILNASPETKTAAKFQSFDKMSKQNKLEWVFTIEKDSKNCFRIHLTDVGSNQTFVFAVRGQNTIVIGNDVLDEATRSAAMMADLMQWLDVAKFYLPIMKLPFDPSKARGGNGGGGNWNRGGNGGGGYAGRAGGGGGYGGAPASQPAPSAGSSDDDGGLPF
jgi:uncharacterized membrane protein YgcG